MNMFSMRVAEKLGLESNEDDLVKAALSQRGLDFEAYCQLEGGGEQALVKALCHPGHDDQKVHSPHGGGGKSRDDKSYEEKGNKLFSDAEKDRAAAQIKAVDKELDKADTLIGGLSDDLSFAEENLRAAEASGDDDAIDEAHDEAAAIEAARDDIKGARDNLKEARRDGDDEDVAAALKDLKSLTDKYETAEDEGGTSMFSLRVAKLLDLESNEDDLVRQALASRGLSFEDYADRESGEEALVMALCHPGHDDQKVHSPHGGGGSKKERNDAWDKLEVEKDRVREKWRKERDPVKVEKLEKKMDDIESQQDELMNPGSTSDDDSDGEVDAETNVAIVDMVSGVGGGYADGKSPRAYFENERDVRSFKSNFERDNPKYKVTIKPTTDKERSKLFGEPENSNYTAHVKKK